MAGTYKTRYSFTGAEIKQLCQRWRAIRGDSEWTDKEEFIKWAEEVKTPKGARLRKKDQDKPFGPGNAYFFESEEKKARRNGEEVKYKQKVKGGPVVSPYCINCKRKCPAGGNGCKGWVDYFKKNWDEDICIRTRRYRTPKKETFKYYHPDEKKRLHI